MKNRESKTDLCNYNKLRPKKLLATKPCTRCSFFQHKEIMPSINCGAGQQPKDALGHDMHDACLQSHTKMYDYAQLLRCTQWYFQPSNVPRGTGQIFWCNRAVILASWTSRMTMKRNQMKNNIVLVFVYWQEGKSREDASEDNSSQLRNACSSCGVAHSVRTL